MRISTIRVNDVPPIKCFNISDLSNVVVIAGRNGIGKTRLVKQLVNYFQNPTDNQNIQLVLDATCETEVEAWGKPQIDTANSHDAELLKNTLQINRLRRNWKSGRSLHPEAQLTRRLRGCVKARTSVRSPRSTERVTRPRLMIWDGLPGTMYSICWPARSSTNSSPAKSRSRSSRGTASTW